MTTRNELPSGVFKMADVLRDRLGREPSMDEIVEALRGENPERFTDVRQIDPIDQAWAEQERLAIEQATYTIKASMASYRVSHSPECIPCVKSLNVVMDINFWKARPSD